MKKVALITGITGQDGSYLAELLLSKKYEVHGIKRTNEGNNLWRIRHILDSVTLHTGDVSDYQFIKELIAEIKPSEVYHLATKHDLPNSLENYLAIKATNLDSTYFLLSSIKKFSQKSKFFFASSSRIFGNPLVSPQNEKTPLCPNSLYGISKVAASSLVQLYREHEGVFACSGILYTHESPRRDVEFLSRKVTLGISRIKLGVESELRLGNLDAKRDWGYAKDYVEGMWLMLQQDKPDDYILATNESHTVREFVEEACDAIGINIHWEGKGEKEKGTDMKTGKVIVRVDPQYFRPAEAHELLGDTKKARKNLKWIPKTTFSNLVKIMVSADLEKERLS